MAQGWGWEQGLRGGSRVDEMGGQSLAKVGRSERISQWGGARTDPTGQTPLSIRVPHPPSLGPRAVTPRALGPGSAEGESEGGA